MSPLVIFLAHRALLDQHTALGEIHGWLRKQGGCRDVRFEPSSIRRHEVAATVDSTIFLGEPHPSETVGLRVAFEYPDDSAHEHYEIQWIDSDRNYSFGWHQDDTHPDLGACHFQLDYQDETVVRNPAVFTNSHPLTVLEKRLAQVPLILELLTWENGRPDLAQWPPQHRSSSG